MAMRLLGIVLCLFIGGGCDTTAAEQFYEHRDSFENNWWAYTLWGGDFCFNVFEDREQNVWIYEEFTEHARVWYPWTFEPPNIYTIEGFEFEVVGAGECYEITVSVLTETVCGCALDWEWREPNKLL